MGMATSAAPTYFPTFRLPGDDVRLIDGGVWCNNPAMVGVTEAVSMFGQPLESIRVLSIGTTASARARPRRLDNAGLLRWVQGPSVVEVLLNGQSAGAFGQVQHLIGADNAYRLNPIAPEGLAALDRCDAAGTDRQGRLPQPGVLPDVRGRLRHTHPRSVLPSPRPPRKGRKPCSQLIRATSSTISSAPRSPSSTSPMRSTPAPSLATSTSRTGSPTTGPTRMPVVRSIPRDPSDSAR